MTPAAAAAASQVLKDRRILDAVGTGAEALSLVGSSFIVLCYLLFRELSKFSFKLVFYLAVSTYIPMFSDNFSANISMYSIIVNLGLWCLLALHYWCTVCYQVGRCAWSRSSMSTARQPQEVEQHVLDDSRGRNERF